jgi:hypothetical protein
MRIITIAISLVLLIVQINVAATDTLITNVKTDSVAIQTIANLKRNNAKIEKNKEILLVVVVTAGLVAFAAIVIYFQNFKVKLKGPIGSY